MRYQGFASMRPKPFSKYERNIFSHFHYDFSLMGESDGNKALPVGTNQGKDSPVWTTAITVLLTRFLRSSVSRRNVLDTAKKALTE